MWPYDHLIRRLISHLNRIQELLSKTMEERSRKQFRACQSFFPPITGPECMGSLVPHGDLSARCLVPPHVTGSFSLHSITAFLGHPSCGSQMPLDCTQHNCGVMTVSTEISKDRTSWQRHGLRTPTPESHRPRKRTATRSCKAIGAGLPRKTERAELPP